MNDFSSWVKQARELYDVRQNLSNDYAYEYEFSEYGPRLYGIGLTSQAYGPRIAKRLAYELSARKNSAKNKCGDIGLVKNAEVKSSIGKDELHIVQIRLKEQCDYIIVFWNLSDNDLFHIFYLTRDEMIKEAKLCRFTAAHGSSDKFNSIEEAIEKEIELRCTLKTSDTHYNRWQQNYKTTLKQIKKNLS